ncbi:hypothetical protein KY290_000939 [Solanum tuberosum]|uniref:Uncharacterized protein n=1 Tax=Solanum tuberosum TaxID=4113 RepID=A0ABQ7WKQ0_SOLTU|nr:hypothetical protein KY290_000939 [Solanum tuberosum]
MHQVSIELLTLVLQTRSMPMLRQSSPCLLLQGLVVTLLQLQFHEFVLNLFVLSFTCKLLPKLDHIWSTP